MQGIVRREDGFTLTEIVVAVSILLVVTAAALAALDSGFSTQAGQQRRAEALDEGRHALHHLTRELRGAVHIHADDSTPSRLDMVTVKGTEERRIIWDLNTDTDVLRRRVTTDGNPVPRLAGLVSAEPFCYDPPDCELQAPEGTPSVIRVTLEFRADTRGAEPVRLSTDVRLRNTGR